MSQKIHPQPRGRPGCAQLAGGMSDEQLCLAFGFAWYEADHVFPGVGGAKWFASVLAGSEFDNGRPLPVGDTAEQVQAAVVRTFHLRERPAPSTGS